MAADRDSGALTVIASLERGDKGGRHLYDVRTWGKIVQKLLIRVKMNCAVGFESCFVSSLSLPWQQGWCISAMEL